MKQESVHKSALTYAIPQPMPDCRPGRTREQALEDLIGVLEMAALQMGWVYRPSVRDSSNVLSQAARLRAAHAAYALASAHIERNTLGRISQAGLH